MFISACKISGTDNSRHTLPGNLNDVVFYDSVSVVMTIIKEVKND